MVGFACDVLVGEVSEGCVEVACGFEGHGLCGVDCLGDEAVVSECGVH